LFVADIIKGWLVGFALGGPFLAAFLKIFKWAGDSFVPFLMAFLCVFPVWTVLEPELKNLRPGSPSKF
jgi:STE24 endopeptidase